MTKPILFGFRTRLLALALAGLSAACANAQTSTNSVTSELAAIIGRIQVKVRAGEATEASLTNEFQALDALIAQHKGDASEEGAQVLMTKARICSEVLRDQKQYDELARQLRRDFPNTKPAAALKRMELAAKAHAELVVGKQFPEFSRNDTTGAARSVSGYKGKILMIDFWATWCGPCVKELPNVKEVYDKHHAEGFEVIGVSLDKDAQKLKSFVEEREIPWPQILDDKDTDDALKTQYGVMAVPSIFLLDRQGKIIGLNVRGEALEKAVAAALAEK
jgi:peroxiredoxin